MAFDLWERQHTNEKLAWKEKGEKHVVDREKMPKSGATAVVERPALLGALSEESGSVLDHPGHVPGRDLSECTGVLPLAQFCSC